MLSKSIKKLTVKEIEGLLNKQTIVILSAVDEKLKKTESRINQKIDRLTTTLDKFLKRMTGLEEEFELMKSDLNKVKLALKEKLGVNLD